MACTGWISIHRQILQCDIWDTDEPYSKRDAWIYLLLKATRQDRTLLIKNHAVELKRGEYCVSERYLATAWKWSRGKVKRYLELLEKLNMIEIKKTEKQATSETVISIVNYSFYQTQEGIDEPLTSHQQTTNEPPVVPKYNNDNKDNNISISKDILRPTKDVERVISEWNNLPDPIQKVSKISNSSQRYKMLNARIKEYGVETVIDAIHKVGGSDFLRRSTWFTFDWFVKPNNFIKVSDGNYNNKDSQSAPNYITTPKEKWDSYMWGAAIKDRYVTREDYNEWRSAGNVII